MSVISTIISFFAAWLIVASPTMACCVTGHMEIGTVAVEATQAPPCHQQQNTQAETEQAPTKFCPSCDDCAVAPSHHGETNPAITTAADLDLIVVAQISAAIIPTDLGLPDSTAPPRRHSLPVDKPLFATDSLLI